ncbi:unnamed protein product [Protopolystoma xenopodis]|uniref:VCBS repeat-containing protein n=1 Tax=Protopolystoma xenopodis TaxID=117903 RepID=A0A3S5AL45_9PLAT|nr:unnamed protein product [Protopolystoma xenopodis]
MSYFTYVLLSVSGFWWGCLIKIAAFADLNADRRTDAVVFNAIEHTIGALMQSVTRSPGYSTATIPAPTLTSPLLSTRTLGNPVRRIAASDFTGSTRVDLLLLTSASRNNGPYQAYLALGLGGSQRGMFGKLTSIAITFACITF